ncbi:MAG: glycosyltransferase [Erysipelotrichaceae bacterium]|nr:glycosyltransferase [Erysipelotrichaceae bacterium]
MIDKRKILFVNDEMRMGGVARVLNTLILYLDKDKYDIDLLVLHPHGTLMKEIPLNVNIIYGTPFFDTIDESLIELLRKFQVAKLIKKLRLLFYMKTGLIKRKIIKERKKMLTKQYDVELACKEGFCTIFTAYGDSLRKLNWVLTDYSVCNYSKNHMPLVKNALRLIDLNIADSKQALEAYEKVFEVDNGTVIHNLMDIDKVVTGMKNKDACIVNTAGLNVISVARFHPQKALDRLLYAHKYAIDRGIEHNLYIVGSGFQEAMLRKIVKDNNLKNVFFVGIKQNPYADIAKCDLYVLCSKYEGFATVINESLIAGTPVLSTRVSGVEEQIMEECHGWICENNQESLNIAYYEALKDPKRLQEMKKALVYYHYPNDEILKQFEEVL